LRRGTRVDSKSLSFDACELDALRASLQIQQHSTSVASNIQYLSVGKHQYAAMSPVGQSRDGEVGSGASAAQGGFPFGEPSTPKFHLDLLPTEVTSDASAPRQRPWSAPENAETTATSPPLLSPEMVRIRQLTPPPHVSGIASEHLPPSARTKRAILELGSPEEAGAVLFGVSEGSSLPICPPMHEESWHTPQGTPEKVPASLFGSVDGENTPKKPPLEDHDAERASAVLTDSLTRPSVRGPRSAMGGLTSFALDNVSASPTPSPSHSGVVDGVMEGWSPQSEGGGGGGVLRKALSRLVRSFNASSTTDVLE